LLADEMDWRETPFQTAEYESFNPGSPTTLKRHFVSSGIYLPLEMETTDGKVVLYTIVAYWLTQEGKVKEDLVALGVELPDEGERFFLDDSVGRDLQAARASMKQGVVFTATLAGFVDQEGTNWVDCPDSDFASRYGEQTCLVGAALAEGLPPDVSSGFTGSFLFGWQLERTGEVIPFPVCQYIEECSVGGIHVFHQEQVAYGFSAEPCHPTGWLRRWSNFREPDSSGRHDHYWSNQLWGCWRCSHCQYKCTLV